MCLLERTYLVCQIVLINELLFLFNYNIILFIIIINYYIKDYLFF